ncbi:MAG: BatD family protein [Candidatus Firestonebacteria bacterium]
MKKIILSIFLTAGLFAAEDITITAGVDRNVVETNDQISLEVKVSGSGASLLKVPQINDFDVADSGQSKQSNFSIVNGHMSSTTTVVYNYVLTPKGAGKFTIPSFTVDFKGKVYRSEPIQIEVGKGNAPAGNPGGAGSIPAAAGNNNLFVQVNVNKNKVYVNEPIVMTFGFYRKINLMGQPQYNPPDSTGFWKEDLPPQINYNSKGYAVTELKTALFPASPGEYTIGKATLACTVPARGQGDDFFENFFERGRNEKLESKPVNITVMPLPKEGKPEDFSGTVGRFNLSVTADKQEVKTNEAVTLTITLAGTGNIKTITEPKLLLSDEFKKYDSVTDMNISKENYEVKGAKTFKTVVVPKKAGKLTIPSVRYSYFDYVDKRYKTLASNPVTLTVSQGPKEEINYADLPSLPSAEGVKVFGTDIRHIKQSNKFSYQKGLFYRSPLFIIINMLPLLAWLFIVAYRRFQYSRERNVVFFKASRAYGKALKRLKAVHKQGKEKCLGQLEIIFAEYIGSKINRPRAGLSVSDIKCVLSERVKDPGLVETAAKFFEELHFLRFAPSGREAADPVKLTEAIKEIIIRLEKAGL